VLSGFVIINAEHSTPLLFSLLERLVFADLRC
jgi:hypothetical protein